ncbi:hypothetical protein AAT17_11050 [Nonlabens sp. MIC269]|nr:hypothetical protein AAT17_11050 [Nonlabens sp. MIC269]
MNNQLSILESKIQALRTQCYVSREKSDLVPELDQLSSQYFLLQQELLQIKNSLLLQEDVAMLNHWTKLRYETQLIAMYAFV